MSDVLALFHIQALELDIIERSKRVKAINLQLEDDSEMLEARTRADDAREAYEIVAKQANDIEMEVGAVAAKRGETETRLYSGEVKNPKELYDMQMEIDSLARRKSVLDEEGRRIALLRADLLSKFNDADATLQELQAARKAENQTLISERDELSDSVSELLAKRKSDLSAVSPDLVSLYNSMRAPKSHRPIAELRDKACAICGIEQNSIVINSMHRKDEIVHCQHCGRILIRL